MVLDLSGRRVLVVEDEPLIAIDIEQALETAGASVVIAATLETDVWQDYDIHSRFPKLMQFLDFWSRNLDGKLYRVTVAHKKLVAPAEFRLVGAEFAVH